MEILAPGGQRGVVALSEESAQSRRHALEQLKRLRGKRSGIQLQAQPPIHEARGNRHEPAQVARPGARGISPESPQTLAPQMLPSHTALLWQPSGAVSWAPQTLSPQTPPAFDSSLLAPPPLLSTRGLVDPNVAAVDTPGSVSWLPAPGHAAANTAVTPFDDAIVGAVAAHIAGTWEGDSSPVGGEFNDHGDGRQRIIDEPLDGPLAQQTDLTAGSSALAAGSLPVEQANSVSLPSPAQPPQILSPEQPQAESTLEPSTLTGFMLDATTPGTPTTISTGPGQNERNSRYTSGLLSLLLRAYAKRKRPPPDLCACVPRPVGPAPSFSSDGNMSQPPAWEAYIQRLSQPSAHAKNCEFSQSNGMVRLQRQVLVLIREAKDS